MKKRFGIWIDHNTAYIFSANEAAVTGMEMLTSEVEGHHHGGINSNEHETLSSQTKHDERRNNEIQKFMKDVLKKIHDGDEILIFGPGNAKNSLKNTIEDTKSMSKAQVTMNVADSMTENQMRQSVQDFFALERA